LFSVVNFFVTEAACFQLFAYGHFGPKTHQILN